MMNVPESDQPRVVIVGGGFGGVALARKLRKAPVQVVMLDRNNYHTFQPLLYQVATGGLEPSSVGFPLRKIFTSHDNFYFRWAEVQRVEHDARRLVTDRGTLPYDYLVMATGTRTNFFGNQDIEQHAMTMKSVPGSLDIRSLALQNLEDADFCDDQSARDALMTICIIGGGPTGVELAGAFAELKRHVFPNDYPHLPLEAMQIHLFEGSDRVLGTMSEKASRDAHRYLESLGVTVHLSALASSYDGEVLTLKDGQHFRTAACIWTAGVTGALVDGFAEASVHGRSQRLHVDEHNQVLGMPNVFAIGDIARMETDAYPDGHPQVAQPAIQQGSLLASNLLAALEGRTMEAFRYRDKGSMATVGRNRAVADLAGLSFGGFGAWAIWMAVHLASLVGFRNRAVVFLNWTYNYVTYDRAVRMIVRPFHRTRPSGSASDIAT